MSMHPEPARRQLLRWFAVASLVATVGVLFRLAPTWIYPKIEARQTARLLIYSGMRKSIEKSVQSSLVNKSGAEKSRVESALLRQLSKKEDEKIKIYADALSEKIVQNEKSAKKPFFLMEVDPFYYYALTRGLVEGRKIDVPKNGRNYLNLRTLAPQGAWYPTDLHPYTGYWLYRLVSSWLPNVSLMETVAWVPVLLGTVLALVFFLFWKLVFRGNILAATVAGTILTLCPMYLNRSLIGWYDTDTYNLLFPLMAAGFLYRALQAASKNERVIYWTAGAILTVAAHALFWRGWLLPFAILGLGLLAAFLTRPAKKTAFIFFAYILSPALFVPLFWGPAEFTNLWAEIKTSLGGFGGKYFDIWPDVFLTVGELRPSRWGSMMEFLGGPLICLASALGISSLAAKKSKPSPWVVFLIVYYLVSWMVGLRVERLILFCVVPVTLGVGFLMEKIGEMARRKRPLDSWALKLILPGLLLVQILTLSYASASTKHPIYNDSWNRIMNYLKTATPADSIVTSWWSPGHFITAMADRRVLFDGSTQNTPQAYWISRFFMERDEKRALSILRMLYLSGNQAVDFLTGHGIPVSGSLRILSDILPLSREDAVARLLKLLPAEEAERLLDLTHGRGELPPAYILVYNDMVSQVMAMEYIGNWNFAKAEQFQKNLKSNPSKISPKLLNRSSKEHMRLIWSLSEGPYYEEAESYQNGRLGDVVRFSNNLTVNLQTMEAFLPNNILGGGKAENVYFMKEGKLSKRSASNAKVRVSVLLIDDTADGSQNVGQKKYRSVIADERLIESMIFQLYYLNAGPFSHIRLRSCEDNPRTQNRLMVFEVRWEN